MTILIGRLFIGGFKLKKNLLYHRVNPKFLNKLLDDGFVKPSKTLDGENAVCLTRDVIYMSRSRPFVIIFDREKLKKFYKVKPCCIIDKLKVILPDVHERFKKHKQSGFENEERVYDEIPLHLAEWYGELSVGCFDYRKPDIIYRIFQ